MDFIKDDDHVSIVITGVISFMNFKKYFMEYPDVKSIDFHIESQDETIDEAFEIIDYLKSNPKNTKCYLNGINTNFGLLIAKSCDESFISDNGMCFVKTPLYAMEGKYSLQGLETLVKRLRYKIDRLKTILNNIELDKSYTSEELVKMQVIKSISNTHIIVKKEISTMYN